MGKTTLAKLASDRPVIHVVKEDEGIEPGPTSVLLVGGYDPETPARIIAAVQALPSFVIEGVQVVRALRGPRGNGIRLPGMVVDAVVYLTAHKVPASELLTGQMSQTVGTDTIFQEWRASNSHVPIFEESIR